MLLLSPLELLLAPMIAVALLDTLDLLVECETGIVGDSYTRNRTKPNVTMPSKAPPVATTAPLD